MKTILRALLALRPLSIGMACLVLSAALTLPVHANAGGPAPTQFKVMHSDRTELGDGIAHYRYDVAMGRANTTSCEFTASSGRTAEQARHRAGRLMLLPGNPSSSKGIFMAPW